MQVVEKSSVSGREVLYGVIGVLVGLLVLSGVWFATGVNTAPLTPISEVEPYPAPDFTLNTLDSAPVSLSDFQGQVVLLNFWGTWCDPCKEETPALEAAYQKLGNEGLVIVGVDLLDSERRMNRNKEHVREFVEQYGVSYPIVLDETGSTGQAYAIAPIPTSYFIDRQGKVRYIRVGLLQASDVERIFRRLQAERL